MITNEDLERIIRSYETWHPALFEQSVKYIATGTHTALIELEDGSSIEYDSRDNTIRDVTRIYNHDENDILDEASWRKEFGHQLRRAIADRGITQEQLSEITGISRQMLSRYVRGSSTPSGYVLSRLSEVLDCDVRKLTRFGYMED